MKPCFAFLALLLAFVPAALSAQAPGLAGSRLRAGAAKVDISPTKADLAIATDSVRDHLYVSAVFLDDGRSRAAIVAVDAGGLGDDVVKAAIAQSSAATGCPPDNYIISATHTHSGRSGANVAQITTAAIVQAVNEARAKLAPARIGYGTAQLDLNVNRDLYNERQEWRQGPNPDGPSDKTLAVVAFVGADDVPIAVYLNYAMHPINFYLSGVVSADFPGEACRYVEDLYGGRTVALFSQGASGDQNPRLGYAPPFSTAPFRNGRGPAPLTVVSGRLAATPAAPAPAVAASTPARGNAPAAAAPGRAAQSSAEGNFNPAAAAAERGPVPPELLKAYHKAIDRVGGYATMLGQMIGSTAERVIREEMSFTGQAPIWGAEKLFSVPGRNRLDADNPARENVFPGYGPGPEVNLNVGLLRVGDVHFARVNAEIYTNIGLRLKKASPASRTLVVTLANGRANSGYIYSDEAYSHLTFQVIGSRIQPGYAEKGIVSTAVDLINASLREGDLKR